MPVADHAIHPSTQKGPDFRYGCWNLTRPTAGAMVTGSFAYGGQQWPFVNTTTCQHDKSQTDPNCAGCEHQTQL